MWLLGALALLLLLSVVFIFYAGRQRRRRMEKEMEFGRLRADVGRRLAEEYVDGLENERQRMSRELHDGVCNDLLAIEMNMEKPDGDRSETIRLLRLCRDSVRRISHELMPPEFAYADLDEVVRYHVDKQNASGTTCIIYRSEGEGWERVSDHVALEIYRIAQEALGNALRHSGADRIEVILSRTDSGITLTVHDNGTGTGANSGSGAGRGSMAKRASMAGGTVRTDSIPGEGTTVTLHIPATE
jgi:putative transmembrane protein